MSNPSLDWLNDLPDLRVTRVTPVTPQKSATISVTQAELAKVTPVTDRAVVTLVTGADVSRVTANPAEIRHVTAVTHVTPQNREGHGLEPDLIAGLDKLRTMPAPRITKPEVWPEIVSDSLRIETEGWASQALALGWDARSLWGVEPSADPDPWDYSLAVVLAGRSIRAVDEHRFYMRDGDVRSFFERRPRPTLTKYLWEI
ncbi:MAG: hypothetical protein AB7G25_06725 [Sphingomonadaceae bacterium]